MIELIVLSIAVAVFVGLVCVGLLGPIIKMLPGPVGVIGDFFIRFGWVLGLLAGLWYFFTKGHLF